MFSGVEQAYGQANMPDMTGANTTETATNMTTANNMSGTEDVNAIKGSVSGVGSSGGEAGDPIPDLDVKLGLQTKPR